MVPQKNNTTLKTVAVALGAVVSLLVIVTIALPDTKECVTIHNDSITSHIDIRTKLKAVEDSVASRQKLITSIKITQDSLKMEQRWFQDKTLENQAEQDKKLDKILNKLNSGG